MFLCVAFKAFCAAGNGQRSGGGDTTTWIHNWFFIRATANVFGVCVYVRVSHFNLTWKFHRENRNAAQDMHIYNV